MRLKYYIRGIGIGIVLATLLLTISFYFGKSNYIQTELSDEEIISRAIELGMIMPDDDSTSDENDDSDEKDVSNENDAVDYVSEDNNEVENEEAEQNDQTEQVELNSENENIENEDVTVTYVPFTIHGGQSSDAVAYNLYKAGLVDSSQDFNTYMNRLGIDNRIQAGTFYIKQGSTYDDIVALLVNKETRTTTPPKED